MNRDATTHKNKVAILATGDEIVNGDILNTNSQIIAQQLFANGIHVGNHLTTSDNVSEIESAINYLLQHHQALIITGGLGPTSDDLTRYAVSKILDKELIFNESAWLAICERFKQLGFKEAPPEGNRQQALFPKDSIIIPNPNGTAAGCVAHKNNQWVFMLPGPPMECLPMVTSIALPMLIENKFQNSLYYDHWFLFGVSEGHIAEILDSLAKPFDVTTGYRLFYPYIEFKLQSNNQHDFETVSTLIQTHITPYLIENGKQPISSLLQKKLEHLDFKFVISDQATGGLLENTLKTPENSSHLQFSSDQPTLAIKGLEDFWQKKESHQTTLEMIFANGHSFKKQIPFRGNRVKQYAVEFICREVNEFLKSRLP